MDEIISNLITTTINSFDFTFCIIVNILTYLVIKLSNDINLNFKLPTWTKRIIFLIVSIIVAIVYYLIGSDSKVLFNSIILAPVSWSWIFKPICAKLNIDYKKDNKTTSTINDSLNDVL